MPDMIRITGGSVWAHPWRSGYCSAIAGSLCWMMARVRAWAADPTGTPTVSAYIFAVTQIDRHEVAALALTLGILCFAVVTAILLVRTRRRLAETETAARDQAIALRARADRATALLQSEPQVVIAWSTTDDEPEMIGDPALVTDLAAPDRVLEFGSWLEPHQARVIEGAVGALRAR